MLIANVCLTKKMVPILKHHNAKKENCLLTLYSLINLNNGIKTTNDENNKKIKFTINTTYGNGGL